MPDWSVAWLAGNEFMPHGHCYLWTPSLLWTYVASDLLIGAAYYSIPLALIYFVQRRRDLQFNWIFILFSLFIFACGTTHLIAVWTIWQPVYWIDASLKAITALLSIVTATLLWPLIPRALRIVSPGQLQEVIEQLEHEVVERREAQTALAQLNETLEQRVLARTAELQASNERLAGEIAARARAEERFRRVVEYAPNGMLMTNQSGSIEMVNAQTEQIFGYSRAELLGQPIELLVPSRFRGAHPELRDSFHNAPGSRAMGAGRDLYGLRKDGSEVPVEIALNPIETGEGLKVLSAIVDISDRKQKEDRIQAALKEKVTLLGEIHHRVKNNLQIVHSLLDLQASQISDPVVKGMLVNSMHRVQSMAVIHQTLYQSENFSQVDLGEVLSRLVANVQSSYVADPQRIRIAVEAEPVLLSITKAIPCGLIVNELITNALKHAFPFEAGGEITVKLKAKGDNRILLSVCDNGVGLKEDAQFADTHTLGLELVTILADQLGGKLVVQRSNPTCFSIVFPSGEESTGEESTGEESTGEEPGGEE
jgi:PAS domain S-box-containing protein